VKLTGQAKKYRVILKELLDRPITRETGWVFVLKIAAAGLSFMVAVVLARILGAEGYGIYAYAYALVSLLALPAQVGLPNLIIRETAKGIVQNEPGLVKGVWSWSGRITGIFSVVLAVGAGTVLYFWHGKQLDQQALTMIWAFVLVPLVALSNLRGAALRGLKKVVAGQLPEFIIRPGMFLVLLILLYLFSSGLSPALAMALHVLASAVAFGVGVWLLWKNTPGFIRNARARFQGKVWLISAVPLAFIAGMQLVNNHTDIIMLGFFVSAEQIGIYKVAVQVSHMAAFGLQAINMVVAPRFASLYAGGEKKKLQRLVTLSARVILVFNIMLTVVFIIFGHMVLGLFFGSEFTASFIPLLILLGGQLFNSAAGSVGVILNMTGNEWATIKGVTIAAALNIILNVILIPYYGINGASIAPAISMTVWNILLWFFVRKLLFINSLAFGIYKLN